MPQKHIILIILLRMKDSAHDITLEFGVSMYVHLSEVQELLHLASILWSKVREMQYQCS